MSEEVDMTAAEICGDVFRSSQRLVSAADWAEA